MRISIVVPCYNSEGSIGKLVEECLKEFGPKSGYELELVLVNDFSRDRTYEVIEEYAAKYPFVKGVNLAKNFGQHGALMCGFQYVCGDIVAGIDDDLQNHPRQIKDLLKKLDEGYDVVFGKYKKRNFGFFKNLAGAISQYLLFHLIDRPAGVEMSSFWVARRYVIDKIKQYRGSDVFVQLLFARTTHRMADVEVEHYARETGHSNYTFRKGLKLFLTFMNFSVIPLQVATLFGILFSAAGFIAAVAIFIRKLVEPGVTIGWSSIMCIILIVAGFNFLMLGIIGSYIGKLIMTSNNSPLFVVRDTINIEKQPDHKSSSVPEPYSIR